MITTGGIMCIMRRCSINGSGTSGNEYSQRTIRRLLEYKPIIVLPFFFLHFFFLCSWFSFLCFPLFGFSSITSVHSFPSRHLQKRRRTIDRAQDRISRYCDVSPFDSFVSFMEIDRVKAILFLFGYNF